MYACGESPQSTTKQRKDRENGEDSALLPRDKIIYLVIIPG